MDPALWPPFGVAAVGDHVELRGVTDNDFGGLIEAARNGVHEPGVETGSFPPTKWTGRELEIGCAKSWWQARVNWSAEAWRLDLVVSKPDDPSRPLGIQGLAAEDFANTGTLTTVSWLTRSAQGVGLGRQMRFAILALAFDGLGAALVASGAEPANIASQRVSLACGYEAVGTKTIDTPDGPLLLNRFELTAERWRELDRPAVRLSGVEGFREFLTAV